MRLFTSAKQANISFARVKSHADILPHWSPSNLGLHFQLSHVLKVVICWRHVEEKGRQKKASLQEHINPTSLPTDLHQIGIPMGHQKGRKSLEFVELGVFVADLSPIKDSSPQQLKTLRSDYYHILLPCQSCLSFTTAWRSLLCSLLWIRPESFLCISVVQQLESKLTSTCTSRRCTWGAPQLRGSCRGDYLTFLDCASGTAKQVSPHVQQHLHCCKAGHLLEEHGGLMFKDCHVLHSSSSKNTARSRSSAPSTGAQSHLSKPFTIRGNTAAMMTHYSGKMAPKQWKAHRLARTET